jgi:tetratricopeptide (TPR) repeat protein
MGTVTKFRTRRDPDAINFGDLPPAINALLQEGVRAYRTDAAAAERFFREALAAAPEELPTYFCLYKIHTCGGNLSAAEATAQSGLEEAARQAGWPRDWHQWQAPADLDGPGRFALYTLKALAFIHLRQDERDRALEILDALAQLDPTGAIGWPVVAAIAEGSA